MAGPRKESKKSKYSKEIEEIRRLHDLNKILKAGDLENALLASSSSDSESMSENVMDSLLEQAGKEAREGSKGLQVIEKLTATGSAGRRVIRERKTRMKSSKGTKKGGKRR